MESALAMLVKAAEVLFLVAIAPLVTGVIKKTKARLQCRRGPGLFQSYRDLAKLFRKGRVVSHDASFVFSVVPSVVLGSTIAAGFLVPVLFAGSGSGADGAAGPGVLGDAILLVGLLSLARFMSAIGALDTGGAFGGMGAAREMTVAAVAEPAIALVIFAVAMGHATTDLGALTAARLGLGAGIATAGTLLGLLAATILLVAETGRIPIDNPDTHLELTMLHEGMLLEHSGPGLGSMVLATSVKQALFMALVADLYFPFGIALEPTAGAILLAALAFAAKAVALGLVLAVIESSTAKLRFFHVPTLMLASLALAFLAVIVRSP